MKLFPASVSAIIHDSKGRILLLSPNGRDHWQTVTGWVEDESLDHAMLREIREELSIDDVELVCTVDAHSFSYKEKDIISVFFLLRYGSGDIRPSDDVRDFSWRWLSKEDIQGLEVSCPAQPEILERAFAMIEASAAR